MMRPVNLIAHAFPYIAILYFSALLYSGAYQLRDPAYYEANKSAWLSVAFMFVFIAAWTMTIIHSFERCEWCQLSDEQRRVRKPPKQWNLSAIHVIGGRVATLVMLVLFLGSWYVPVLAAVVVLWLGLVTLFDNIHNQYWKDCRHQHTRHLDNTHWRRKAWGVRS